MAILENVTFVYTKIQQPGTKYQSEEKEYSVDCIVSKTQAKEWNKKFQKQKARVVDNEDFATQYKIDPVFADQDEQYVVKLKQATAYKDGTPLPDTRRPRVFNKNESGRLVDITMSKLVGNGSKGAAEYSETSNDFGTFARLSNIRVDSLIEYVQAGGTGLGEVEGPLTDLGDSNTAEAKPAAKRGKTEPVEVDDSFDENIPF